MGNLKRQLNPFLHILILALVASACAPGGESTVTTSPPTPVPPTRTPFPPSPTPVPIAATVNGERITMAEYLSELARFKAAVDRELDPEDKKLVIRDMVQLTLLAQGANSRGYEVTEDMLQERLSQLDTGNRPLDDWLSKYGYTKKSFQKSLARSMAAAWMRDTIIDRVPQEEEQIHAQQILLYEEKQAEAVLSEVKDGTRFAQLAKEYDPQTNGDLGWFPRGYLTMPELDETLFNLESGKISDIIETDIGYHIIKVLEKEENRPLDPDVRQTLQKKALHEWLESQWNSSNIVISISE